MRDPASRNNQTVLGVTGRIQGGYYIATGLWALISIETFQWVTGPKTDLWLVKTVGVLVIVIGLVLLTASLRKSVSLEIFILGLGSCLGLGIIEVVYVLGDRISLIYGLDGLLEAGFVLGWIYGWLTKPEKSGQHGRPGTEVKPY